MQIGIYSTEIIDLKSDATHFIKKTTIGLQSGLSNLNLAKRSVVDLAWV